MTLARADRRRFAAGTGIGGALGLLIVALTLGGGRFDFSRTAIPGGVFADFFDKQARALLRGRFALPNGSLAIESFVIDGKTYTYFPPFPALLRIPVLLVTRRFDGHLTGVSMMLGSSVFAFAVAALLWRIRFLVRGDATVSRRDASIAGLFVLAAVGGSGLVYLNSLPWAYHEVYVWSVALSAVSMWAITGILTEPRPSSVVIAGASVTAVCLTRSTVGWGLCLALLACAAWSLRSKQTWSVKGRPWLWLVAAAIVPFTVGIAITWVKFGSPFRFLPLDTQVWTRVNEQRRRALAANGGGLTNPAFVPTTLNAYLNPLNIRLRPYFPFFTLPSSPPPVFGTVVFDQTYRVGAVTAFMPMLTLLAATGSLTVLRRPSPLRSRRLVVLLVGTLFVLGGVLEYGYMAHRYLGDFLPFLVCAGAIGAASVGGWVDTLNPLRARAAVLGFAGITCWGVVANAAVAATAMSLSGGSRNLAAYVDLQLRTAKGLPGISAPPIQRVDTLPAWAATDTIVIVGGCEAMFLATGETHEPWALVETRSAKAVLEVPDGGIEKGTAPLVSFDGPIPAGVDLESDGRGLLRMRLRGAATMVTDWFAAVPGRRLEFGISASADDQQWVVVGPDLSALFVPVLEYDANWFRTYRVPKLVYGTPSESKLGWRVTWAQGPSEGVCERALAATR